MQESKRIILLENLGSDNIEQAIIILKENTGMKNSSIIREAEDIVSRFIKKQYMMNFDAYEAEQKEKEKNKNYGLVAFGMITLFVALAALIWFI